MIVFSPSTTAHPGIQLAAMTAGQAMRGDGLAAGDHLGDRDGLVLRVHGARLAERTGEMVAPMRIAWLV
jgi:hypothetical protein